MSQATIPARMRYSKVNPECTADRHRPEQRSYTAGCRCPDAIDAHEKWLRRGAKRIITDPAQCPGKRHTATNDAWRLGCRCPDAIDAHSEWVAHQRERRAAAVAHWRVTGECVAVNHDSAAAYRDEGCRCPDSVQKNDRVRARDRANRLAGPGSTNPRRPVVGRFNVMMLMAGIVVDPTADERMIAVMRLAGRCVPEGPICTRPMNNLEIAELVGCTDREVYRLRRRTDRLREERHLRRRDDVRIKAGRVARAAKRKAALT